MDDLLIRRYPQEKILIGRYTINGLFFNMHPLEVSFIDRYPMEELVIGRHIWKYLMIHNWTKTVINHAHKTALKQVLINNF